MAEVLVADDDPHVRSLLSYTLSGAGFEVVEVGDGAAAINALIRQAPACAVIDVMMPNVDGFGVLTARRDQKLAPQTRFVMLTARTAEADFLRGYELGVDKYLTKPFSPDDLVRTVQDLLATSLNELRRRRSAELGKAELLRRVEWTFRRRPGEADPPPTL